MDNAYLSLLQRQEEQHAQRAKDKANKERSLQREAWNTVEQRRAQHDNARKLMHIQERQSMQTARQDQIDKNYRLTEMAKQTAYKQIRVPGMEIQGASKGRANHLKKYLNP